jgi:catechol 2,3-dioxygenase-like lactoylglutathione lyase family enzyme
MSNKLRHIAMSVPDPWKTAEFYINAFGFKKVGETDSSLARGVYLSDGVMSIALLNYKTDQAAGEERGKDYVGLHHIGVWVDDITTARADAEAAGGTY